MELPVIRISVHGTHRSLDPVVVGSPVDPVRAAVTMCRAVHGLPACPVPGDARAPNEPVAGGWPRRHRQQRLFLDVEPARFGRPHVVDRRHCRPVPPAMAGDVDLTVGSESAFWRSAMRAMVGTLLESLGGGDVDRRRLLHKDQSRGGGHTRSGMGVRNAAEATAEIVPCLLSLTPFLGASRWATRTR